MEGHEENKSTTVAVKVARTSRLIANPLLRHEACVLLKLQGDHLLNLLPTLRKVKLIMLWLGHPGIPDVHAWGRSNYHEYLAMQLLGELLKPTKPIFTVGELASLTCQMVSLNGRLPTQKSDAYVLIYRLFLRCTLAGCYKARSLLQTRPRRHQTT